MKKCKKCGETEQDKFYKELNTICAACQRAKQLEFNRNNPEYLKAKNQRRRARKLALQNDLKPKQWKDILERFGGKCALTDSTDIVLEHIIPLENMHGGTTVGNVIPMDATLNLAKRDKNFIDWVNDQDIKAIVDQNKLNELLQYLAEINGLTVKRYIDYVYWCERNKRSIEEAEADSRPSIEIFKSEIDKEREMGLMEKKTIENGRFKATYHNEKTAYLDGVKIFRHRDGIAFELNGQLTSINDKGKNSVRGANDLYNKLNAILLELGVEEGEYEKNKKKASGHAEVQE